MLRVAGLGDAAKAGNHEASGPEGALVEFCGCKLLVGCPIGTAGDLSELGVKLAEVDALLLCSGRSLAGWPAVWAANGRQISPRLRILGTAPMLLAAEALLHDLCGGTIAAPAAAGSEAAAGPLLPAFSESDVAAMLQACESVSYRQEVVIEGSEGPLFLRATASGYGLGAAYWIIEALGIRVATVGPATATSTLLCRPFDAEMLAGVDVLLLLQSARRASSRQDEQANPAHAAAKKVVEALKPGSCALLPVGMDFAPLVDLVEALGQAIAGLEPEAQLPLFVVGAAARFLHRCDTFCEWAAESRLEYAFEGKAPFMLDALTTAGRLVLGNSVPELAGVYREPCAVIASAHHAEGSGAAPHFQRLWAAQKDARVWHFDAACPACEKSPHPEAVEMAPIELRLSLPQVEAMLQGTQLLAAVVANPPSGLAAAESMVALNRARRAAVPLDLRLPKVQCWLPAPVAAEVEAQLPPPGEGDVQLCRFEGAVVGNKRPRLTRMPALGGGVPPPPMLIGKADVDAFVKAVASRGLSCKLQRAAGGARLATTFEIPSLEATVTLNAIPEGEDSEASFETVIKAKSGKGRLLLTEILEELLTKL